MNRPIAALLIGIAAAFGPPQSLAQQQAAGTADADALARQLSNPVAALNAATVVWLASSGSLSTVFTFQ